MKNADNSRVFGLDLMRTIAILTVVYAHGHSLIAHKYPDLNRLNIDGVTIFFVLSGYLIGRILIRDSQTNGCNFKTLTNFWTRRWLRTLPAYFVVLTILIFLTRALEQTWPAKTLFYFIFSQNIAWSHPPFFGEAWSLAVEEWFYLIVPLFLFCIVRATNTSVKRAILAVAFLIIVSSTTFRIFRITMADIQTVTQWDSTLRKVVMARLDSLMFGVIGAYFSIFAESKWKKWKKCVFIVGIFLLLVDQILQTNDFWRVYITLTITPLAALCLLPFLSSWRDCPHPSLNIITFISLISYSLYLVHLSLIKNVFLKSYVENVPVFLSNTVIIYILYWTVSIALAYLIWSYIEKPFLMLRERNFRIKLLQVKFGK